MALQQSQIYEEFESQFYNFEKKISKQNKTKHVFLKFVAQIKLQQSVIIF